jgi:hypothetical protein
MVPSFCAPVHTTVRTLAEYTEALKAKGFVIESVYPANVLLNTPLEASNRLTFRAYRLLWEVSRRWGRSNLLSRLFGPGLLLADRLACRRFAGAPPQALRSSLPASRRNRREWPA